VGCAIEANVRPDDGFGIAEEEGAREALDKTVDHGMVWKIERNQLEMVKLVVVVMA